MQTVFLVDDDAAILKALSRVLREEGWEVLEARDGLHALDLAATSRSPIDLLISDLGMPHMGGVELAQRMAVECPDMPVAFMSGYAFEMNEAAQRLPGVDCLEKPFTPSDLSRFVRRQIGRARESRADMH